MTENEVSSINEQNEQIVADNPPLSETQPIFDPQPRSSWPYWLASGLLLITVITLAITFYLDVDHSQDLVTQRNKIMENAQKNS